MPALVAGIHALPSRKLKREMAGTKPGHDDAEQIRASLRTVEGAAVHPARHACACRGHVSPFRKLNRVDGRNNARP
jgi:hypothetical protein